MHAINLFTPQSYDFAEHLLTQKAADISVKTYSGNNAFHNFAMKFAEGQIFVNKLEQPVQHAKALQANKQLYNRFFDLMIAHGASPNEKNLGGFTPLSICLSLSNTAFLARLADNPDLRVDQVVKDKSELHYVTDVILKTDTPQILEKLLAKTRNFGLLMQLYDLESGFNIFHAILDRVAQTYFGFLDSKKAEFQSQNSQTLQVLNRLKQDTQSKTKRAMGLPAHMDLSTAVAAGTLASSGFGNIEDLIIELEKAETKCERAKAKHQADTTKKNLIKYYERLYDTLKLKYSDAFMEREEERLKSRIEAIFGLFADQGYDFSQRVRLYKRKIEKKNISEIGHSNHYARNQRFNNKDANAGAQFEQWKDKDYKVNKRAKDSVFHIIMKKANIFLFEYFEDQLEWTSNMANFRGDSLISTLVQNFHAGTPKMDLKVYDQEYDRLAHLREIEELKKGQPGRIVEEGSENQPDLDSLNLFGGFGGNLKMPANPNLFSGVQFAPKKAYTARKRPRRYKTTARKSRGGFGGFGGHQAQPAHQANTAHKGFTMPTAQNQVYNWTTLNNRFENETLQMIGKLLDKGDNPDLPNKLGLLPILKVALNGGNDLLHLLVRHGTDLNVIDKHGQNPLLLFAKRRDLKSCEYLLANGANIKISDPRGRNALHWSLSNTDANSSSNFDLEEVLIRSGVEVNQKDRRGLTPVNYLFTKIGAPFIKTKIDPIEIFSYLLSLNTIQLESQDRLGNRLLHYAAQRGAYLCVLYLLRAKAEVNVYNKVRNSPFNISLLNSHNDVAIILLQHSAQVNDMVYTVDHASKRQYHLEKKKRNQEKAKEEQENSQQSIIEEEDEEGLEEEENSQEIELEDESGLVEEAVIEKFKEDSESESEAEWEETQRYLKKRGKKGAKIEMQKTEYGDESDLSESEYGDQPAAAHTHDPYGYMQNYQMYDLANPYGNNSWMKTQLQNKLKTTIQSQKQSRDNWKRLCKLKARNFVQKVASQFRTALEHSMLSVNFLLVDFGFELGQAVMDAFAMKNFGYAKTLLNKKVPAARFQFKDTKGRDLAHYLASFGAGASQSDLDYFFDAIQRLGLALDQTDCLQREPAHYAALNGHLRFIERLHQDEAKLARKDIFGCTLLSLYLKNNAPDKERIRLFVQDLKNDINCIFKESQHEFVTELEKFELTELTQNQIKKQIKQVLRSPKKSDLWGWKQEFKAREGKVVEEQKQPAFKKWSVLMYVALKKRNLGLVQSLVELGADLNSRDHQGRTLLAHAIKKNDLRLMELLKSQEDKIDFAVTDLQKVDFLIYLIGFICWDSESTSELVYSYVF